mmetsp:Transcript_90148/g.254226  ORF Transcript_90148/g.254226 Transcript_90148/m.254226 type:complete len:297 (-) Transcript_90148:316-1206(-)|eukprot:CAMPEP_0117516386 /NCGR_PEP_ID=MMETSP0784-20121206/31067_1 /TAXON_ID=39447 /ORGANISM="" /LENGTH=296 /DNA_ID=CAMNT_0005312229 /DNA_START=81 /DNA_END=971 /DNA_ORIENTATION=+
MSFVPRLALRSSRWRTLRTTGGLVAGTGTVVALNQALDLGVKWEELRPRASACRGPTEGMEIRRHASATSEPAEPLLLLFIGDSLVSGVGAGQQEGVPMPAALPRFVAARLADCLGGQVDWASVGITGADVRCLTSEGLPRLREKIAAWRSRSATEGIVVVVLVVGANDLRKLNFMSYRQCLRNLVNELRYIDRKDKAVDAVFLPEVRIPDAVLLQRFPLQYFLEPVCALWEREKKKAISWFREAQVLPFPALPRGVDPASLFSPDQVHPSLSGYEWWAESIATQIHKLQSSKGRA